MYETLIKHAALPFMWEEKKTKLPRLPGRIPIYVERRKNKVATFDRQNKLMALG